MKSGGMEEGSETGSILPNPGELESLAKSLLHTYKQLLISSHDRSWVKKDFSQIVLCGRTTWILAFTILFSPRTHFLEVLNNKLILHQHGIYFLTASIPVTH